MGPNQALEAEKKKFDTLLSAINEGVIVFDLQQKITAQNDKAKEITEFGFTNTIEKPVGEIIKVSKGGTEIPVDRFCPPGELDLEGVVFSDESLDLLTATGDTKKIKLETIKMKGGSLVNVGGMIIITDVFEKEDLERMKLDFVSMSVHVLRTPISALRGYLENLNKKETAAKLDLKERENLEGSLESVDRLGNLVENLLNFAGFQGKRLTPNFVELNLEGLVQKSVEYHRPNAESKGLKLYIVPSSQHLPMIKGDITLLETVVNNLLKNAINFTEKGSVQVSTKTQNDSIVVSIKDTGRGIPEENISKLFTTFYRVKSPLDMEHGEGIGLYISKKIIDSHNGKIWAESVVGQGSNFSFSLPLTTSIH